MSTTSFQFCDPTSRSFNEQNRSGYPAPFCYVKQIFRCENFLKPLLTVKDESYELIIDRLIASKLPSRANILHLGSGFGHLSHKIKRIFPDCVLTDLDISEIMLQFSPADRKFNLDALYLSQISSMDKYDCIISHGFLRYIPLEEHDLIYYSVNKLLNQSGFFLFGEGKIDFLQMNCKQLGYFASDLYRKSSRVFRYSHYYRKVLSFDRDLCFRDRIQRNSIRKYDSQKQAALSAPLLNEIDYKQADIFVLEGRKKLV